MYGRVMPASVAIILGAVVIIMWKLLRYLRSGKPPDKAVVEAAD